MWSISLRKPRESRLMVKSALSVVLMPNTERHTTDECLVLLEKRDYNMYFKALYSIASRQPISVFWVALQLCRNTL